VKRIEIQATGYCRNYAKVEGCRFSIGHIINLYEHEPKDGKPFFTKPCIAGVSPELLYKTWSIRLDNPKEWIWGNDVVGLDDKPYGMPTCPTCGDVTYSMERCPFCNQMLKDPMPEVDKH